MNGKVLKVKQYNLEFGSNDRFVNILGCFKYKNNGNVYVIYSDTNSKYNIIYYGSGHIRENTILCMQCRDKTEEEIIKEYIFKTTQNQPLDNFEIFSLENVEAIEIIASTQLDIKPEILTNLINILIPKPIIKEEQPILQKTNKPHKKTPKNILIILIITLSIGIIFFLTTKTKDTTEKIITCTKTYSHDTLTATVTETNKYNFNINDKLERVDSTIIYQFNETNYQDFIMRGTYYRYMPSSNTEGGWDKNDDEYWFKVTTKIRPDTSYNEPTDYEEALSYYKVNEYTCKEEITNE